MTPLDTFRRISPEEETALLEQCPRQVRCAFQLLFLTGLRSQELRLLNIGDLQGDQIRVPSLKRKAKAKLEEGKTRSQKAQQGLNRSDIRAWRTIDLTPTIRAIFDTLAGGRGQAAPLLVVGGKRPRREWLSRRFRSAWDRAGLRPGIRLHDIRHTFGSRFMAEAKDIVSCQTLMGHQKPETTLQYAHATQEEKIAGLQAVEQAGASRT